MSACTEDLLPVDGFSVNEEDTDESEPRGRISIFLSNPMSAGRSHDRVSTSLPTIFIKVLFVLSHEGRRCLCVTYNRDKSRDVQEASLKIISVPAPDVLSETITGPPAVDSLMKDGIKLHPQAAPPPPSIAHHFFCY